MKDRLFNNIYLLFLLAIAFFFPFLGAVHLFDWDEINFAEAAREMLVTGNYSRVQIDYQIFTEKPPLFFWMQALSMKFFGVNEFASRLPNAICGVLTLSSLYLVGKKLKDSAFGLIWALAYLGSFLPHLYFKSGIIDPFFNLFMFLAVVFISKTVDHYGQQKSWRFSALTGIFIGLAILTKGPVGLLIPLLTFFIYWFTLRRSIVSIGNLLICIVCTALVTLIWLGPETYKYGFTFIKEFTERQVAIFSTSDADHGEPWYYHPIVLFFGCFPIAQLAFRSFIFSHDTDQELFTFKKWMVILFWVVLVLFSIVKTKIVHYSSMCYFPISFLAAYHLYYILNGKIKINRATIIMLISVGFVFSLLLSALPIVGMNAEKLTPYINDPFAVGNLQAKVYWSGFEILIGVFYFFFILFSIYLLRKKKTEAAVYSLFLSTALCMMIYTKVVVPKIELYSQGAALRFYESLQGKDAYVRTLGFKSYAQLFYFKKPPVINPKSYDENWVLTGDIDKDAYFVGKIQDAERYKIYKDLVEINRENGFIFYLRKTKLKTESDSLSK